MNTANNPILGSFPHHKNMDLIKGPLEAEEGKEKKEETIRALGGNRTQDSSTRQLVVTKLKNSRWSTWL